ncbi:MAG: hypothetical protein AAF641_12050 [Pseudomonadota bacterium]
MGRHADALAIYDSLVGQDPDNGMTLQNRGRLHQKVGNAEAALADWAASIDVGRDRAIRAFQAHLSGNGFYDGETDGEMSDALQQAINRCAHDPACFEN